jgi:hypothetical protein
MSRTPKVAWAFIVLAIVSIATSLLPGLGTMARTLTATSDEGSTGCAPTAATPIPQPTRAELDSTRW